MDNKWLLLTGGTGHLGQKFIQDLLDNEWNVAFVGHTQAKITAIMEKFSFTQRLFPIQADLTQETSYNAIIKALEEHVIHPSAFVHNATNNTVYKPNDQGFPPLNQWLHDFSLHVYTAYALTMALAQQEKSRLTNVVNICSIYGIVAPTLSIYTTSEPNPINYGVCKAALIHLSRQLAVRLAYKNINVNSISYGGVEGRASEEFKQAYGKRCPQKKMLHLDEVSKPLLFLLSTGAQGITGHNLVVDGGWTAC